MVKIHFTTVGPRLRNDDVRRAEALLGVTLPLDYVRFLFESNGGWVGDSAGSYCFPIYGLKGEDAGSIHVMHSVLRTDDDSGILDSTRSIMDRLPDGVVVIGYDLAGGLLVLGTPGEYRNRVLLRVIEEEVPGDPHSGLFDIAGTFTELLDSIWYELHEVPPDEDDA